MAYGNGSCCRWTYLRHVFAALIALILIRCGRPDTAQLDASVDSFQALGQAPEVCQLEGTWALQLRVPVQWKGTVGIRSGRGTVVQWIQSVRKRSEQYKGEVVDTLRVCGISVPDFYSRSWGAKWVYGVSFPDSLFDRQLLPTSQVKVAFEDFKVGSRYVSGAAAIQLGIALENPVEDPWPAIGSHFTRVVDTDQDGYPGVTLRATQGNGYMAPPVNLFGQRADRFHTVIRDVASSIGWIASCNTLQGSLTIPILGGRHALNSYVIGCQLLNGELCRSREVRFLNTVLPVYEVTGQGQVVMHRVSDDASCKDIRQAVF